MKNPDILLAIKPVVSAFNQLSIPYYIGGSIASSVYGIARATMDIDVIAHIVPSQVSSLVALLEREYYIDKQMIDDAISNASSFNLIHLETMMKVDVFTQRKEPYHESALARRLRDLLVEGDQDSAFFFSSPEDIILSKLRWYEMGGQISGQQWRDILGVLKMQGKNLDLRYLEKAASDLNVADLLVRALSEAGL